MEKKTALLLVIVTMATGLSLASSISLGEAGLIPGANDPSKADLKVMTDNRSLISTRIDPSKGQAEGYVAGIDEGSLDMDDLKLFMAQLKGKIKSAFRRHPEETQVKMVTVTSMPDKTTRFRSKRKIKHQTRVDQQKI